MAEPLPDASARRVLVVDTDDRTRESLARLLGIGGRCTVVGQAGRPDEALALLARFAPDVVIVDPRLPDIDGGRAFIAAVREQSPKTGILVMGWSDRVDPDGLVDDVDGFVRKTFRARDLLDAVEAVVGRRSVA